MWWRHAALLLQQGAIKLKILGLRTDPDIQEAGTRDAQRFQLLNYFQFISVQSAHVLILTLPLYPPDIPLMMSLRALTDT